MGWLTSVRPVVGGVAPYRFISPIEAPRDTDVFHLRHVAHKPEYRELDGGGTDQAAS